MDGRTRFFLAGGLVLTLIVAIAVSQFASDRPDGLEYVAEHEGFADAAREHELSDTALADYGDGLTDNSVANTAIAGLIGVLATLGLGWVVFRLIRRRDDGAVTH